MYLSELINLIENLELLIDSEFDSLGLAGSICSERICTFLEDEKYIDGLSTNITAVITNKNLAYKLKDRYGVIISDNPRMDYFKIHNILAKSNLKYCRVKKQTDICETATISTLASISNVNVKIGKNVIIEEFVVIRENVEIKDNCIIRAGCIIGGEGYEFKRTDGIIMNVIHTGGVIIGENVELQYNSCVDKALYTWDNTVIDQYSKLDNFVHIEHGVKIGQRCLIASRTTIGGRTIIGNDSWIGLGAIVSNGLVIGEKSYISLGSVVTKSICNMSKVSGNFAIEHNKYIEFIKKIR